MADAFGPGDHGTTFGGSCLAIAAANCVLDELGREGEIERIEAAGEHLAGAATLPHVKEVRGLGLMRAVEFDDSVDAPALVLAALDAPQGLVLNYTGAAAFPPRSSPRMPTSTPWLTSKSLFKPRALQRTQQLVPLEVNSPSQATPLALRKIQKADRQASVRFLYSNQKTKGDRLDCIMRGAWNVAR